ncbi:hypothetical protein BX265_0540 [Streptomyces sp. TLI_235]|nr:hypothetical protein [Streptomyces sp. TLI_235]PBC75854.1 hypothetical protein BX265_0540 [Streptomyces sp. TLI_235]
MPASVPAIEIASLTKRYGRTVGAEALLADGTTAILRPLGPEDRAAALDLHAVRMSEASRRMRFFGASRLAPQLAADRLCGPPRPGFLRACSPNSASNAGSTQP